MAEITGRRIVFMGPSGIGKTTLAKYLSEKYHIPFVTGSYSDLVPRTKLMTHKDMINLSPEEIIKSDMELLRARIESYKYHTNGMVSDRSPLDIAAYSIVKLSGKVKDCDLEPILDLVWEGMQYVDSIIFMPFHIEDMYKWEIEDNGKRIKSKYFQVMVSSVMEQLFKELVNYPRDIDRGSIPVESLEIRQNYIDLFMESISTRDRVL